MCYILFVCNRCVVLENEKYNINELIETFTDIKLIDNCISTPFKEILHKKVFTSLSECKSMYNKLKSTLRIDPLQENLVKYYINLNYIITEEVNDKIKYIKLYNLCKNTMKTTLDSIEFSNILIK